MMAISVLNKWESLKDIIALQGSTGCNLQEAFQKCDINERQSSYFLKKLQCQVKLTGWSIIGDAASANVSNINIIASPSYSLQAFGIGYHVELLPVFTTVLELLAKAGPKGCLVTEIRAISKRIISISRGKLSHIRTTVIHLKRFASEYDPHTHHDAVFEVNKAARLGVVLLISRRIQELGGNPLRLQDLSSIMGINFREIVEIKNFVCESHAPNSLPVQFFEALNPDSKRSCFWARANPQFNDSTIVLPALEAGKDDKENGEEASDDEEESASLPFGSGCLRNAPCYGQADFWTQSAANTGITCTQLQTQLGVGKKRCIRIFGDLINMLHCTPKKVQTGKTSHCVLIHPEANACDALDLAQLSTKHISNQDSSSVDMVFDVQALTDPYHASSLLDASCAMEFQETEMTAEALDTSVSIGKKHRSSTKAIPTDLHGNRTQLVLMHLADAGGTSTMGRISIELREAERSFNFRIDVKTVRRLVSTLCSSGILKVFEKDEHIPRQQLVSLAEVSPEQFQGSINRLIEDLKPKSKPQKLGKSDSEKDDDSDDSTDDSATFATPKKQASKRKSSPRRNSEAASVAVSSFGVIDDAIGRIEDTSMDVTRHVFDIEEKMQSNSRKKRKRSESQTNKSNTEDQTPLGLLPEASQFSPLGKKSTRKKKEIAMEDVPVDSAHTLIPSIADTTQEPEQEPDDDTIDETWTFMQDCQLVQAYFHQLWDTCFAENASAPLRETWLISFPVTATLAKRVRKTILKTRQRWQHLSQSLSLSDMMLMILENQRQNPGKNSIPTLEVIRNILSARNRAVNTSSEDGLPMQPMGSCGDICREAAITKLLQVYCEDEHQTRRQGAQEFKLFPLEIISPAHQELASKGWIAHPTPEMLMAWSLADPSSSRKHLQQKRKRLGFVASEAMWKLLQGNSNVLNCFAHLLNPASATSLANGQSVGEVDKNPNQAGRPHTSLISHANLHLKERLEHSSASKDDLHGSTIFMLLHSMLVDEAIEDCTVQVDDDIISDDSTEVTYHVGLHDSSLDALIITHTANGITDRHTLQATESGLFRKPLNRMGVAWRLRTLSPPPAALGPPPEAEVSAVHCNDDSSLSTAPSQQPTSVLQTAIVDAVANAGIFGITEPAIVAALQSKEGAMSSESSQQITEMLETLLANKAIKKLPLEKAAVGFSELCADSSQSLVASPETIYISKEFVPAHCSPDGSLVCPWISVTGEINEKLHSAIQLSICSLLSLRPGSSLADIASEIPILSLQQVNRFLANMLECGLVCAKKSSVSVALHSPWEEVPRSSTALRYFLVL